MNDDTILLDFLDQLTANELTFSFDSYAQGTTAIRARIKNIRGQQIVVGLGLTVREALTDAMARYVQYRLDPTSLPENLVLTKVSLG